MRPLVIDRPLRILPSIQGSAQKHRIADQLPGRVFVNLSNVEHGSGIQRRVDSISIRPYHIGASSRFQTGHVQRNPFSAQKASVFFPNSHRILPGRRVRDAPSLLQPHQPALRSPFPGANGKQNIQPSSDHVKFRRPKGLNQLPFFIIIQDHMLFHMLSEQLFRPLRLTYIEPDIVPVIIGRDIIIFSFPRKDHRISPAAVQRERISGTFYPASDQILSFPAEIQAGAIPVHLLLCRGTVRIDGESLHPFQLLRIGNLYPFRQVNPNVTELSPIKSRPAADSGIHRERIRSFPLLQKPVFLHQSACREMDKILRQPQKHLSPAFFVLAAVLLHASGRNGKAAVPSSGQVRILYAFRADGILLRYRPFREQNSIS